jgi:hypothetical protein
MKQIPLNPVPPDISNNSKSRSPIPLKISSYGGLI